VDGLELSLAQKIAVWILPVVFAITVHEVAHGWIAKQLGDPTALMLGRLTLNPFKHIDPVGTLLVPGILLLIGSVLFGWAKPVPITWRNLKRPKRDIALVALAGPGANLCMAILWAFAARLGVGSGDTLGWFAEPLIYMGIAGIFINTVMLVVNLFPLPPLDGGRVLTGVLPGPLAWKVAQIEPYGLVILLLLLFLGVLGRLIWPVVFFVQGFISHLAGISPHAFMETLRALIGA
jgi:Zn-dependent protease